MEPDNVRGLETSASLLLELGDVESAKHVSNVYSIPSVSKVLL